jgi:hypothetical protein
MATGNSPSRNPYPCNCHHPFPVLIIITLKIQRKYKEKKRNEEGTRNFIEWEQKIN